MPADSSLTRHTEGVSYGQEFIVPLSTGWSVGFAALLFLGANASAQTVRRDGDVTTLLGRRVTATEGERDPRDPDGDFPKGPASVCLEAPPQQQCYTAPTEYYADRTVTVAKAYGNDPTVSVVQVGKDMPALLFSVAAGGTSGWSIHFALLRPGAGTELKDLFPSDLSVSNQSQHEFLSDPTISDAQIFVTADYAVSPGESHYGEHRYIISAYFLGAPEFGLFYYLGDRYMTVRKYDLDGGADVLASEKQEILTRLLRVKGDSGPAHPAPR